MVVDGGEEMSEINFFGGGGFVVGIGFVVERRERGEVPRGLGVRDLFLGLGVLCFRLPFS